MTLYNFPPLAIRRLGSTAVAIEVEKSNLFAHLLGRAPESPSSSGAVMKLTSKFQVQRRAGELQILGPGQSPVETTASVPVAKAVIQARDWYEHILSGKARQRTSQ